MTIFTSSKGSHKEMQASGLMKLIDSLFMIKHNCMFRKLRRATQM